VATPLWRCGSLRYSQHAHAELLDQLPEALTGAHPRRLAAERNRDDLGGRRLDRFLQRGGGGVLRRSEKQPGREVLAINFEHQPPCLGATISTASFGASGVSPRLVEATKHPLTAVATFASAK
jgi:hypothetical protein